MAALNEGKVKEAKRTKGKQSSSSLNDSDVPDNSLSSSSDLDSDTSSGNLFEDSRLEEEESHDESNEDEPIEGDSNTLGGTKHTRRKEIADVKLKLTLLQY